MKKVIKVFNILFAIFCCFAIYPIVFCVIQNKKLETEKSAKKFLGWGIANIILGNPVSGILMLVMKDEHLA